MKLYAVNITGKIHRDADWNEETTRLINMLNIGPFVDAEMVGKTRERRVEITVTMEGEDRDDVVDRACAWEVEAEDGAGVDVQVVGVEEIAPREIETSELSDVLEPGERLG